MRRLRYWQSRPVLKTLSEIEEHTDLNLEKAKIVALNMDGRGGDVAFSYDQLDDLIEFIGKLRGTLIILCRGLLKIVVEDYQKLLLKIFETADTDLKIIAFTNWKSCSDEELAAISGMFEVSIHIQKTDEVFSFGDEIYELNVMQSVVTYIPPGTVYFRVGENLEIEEQA